MFQTRTRLARVLHSSTAGSVVLGANSVAPILSASTRSHGSACSTELASSDSHLVHDRPCLSPFSASGILPQIPFISARISLHTEQVLLLLLLPLPPLLLARAELRLGLVHTPLSVLVPTYILYIYESGCLTDPIQPSETSSIITPSILMSTRLSLKPTTETAGSFSVQRGRRLLFTLTDE